MTLSDLQIFCDVVDARSFTAAAERGFVSQSAVSQRIRALERKLGQVLLERGQGRGRVAPTEAGLVLYEGARRLLADAAELQSRLRGLGEEIGGTVRVATVYSVGLHALPGRLKPFLASHPRVNVRLEYSQTGKIYQDVLSGVVDVGIVACPAARAGIEVVPFGEEEMVLICAPENPLAARSSLSLRELEGAPYIAFADDIPTRRLTDERLRAANVRVNVVMAFDNIETIKNLVEIGTGIALVPADSVRQEVRGGTLAVVPLSAEDAFRRPAGIVLKKSTARRPAVQAFVTAVRASGPNG